MARNSSIRVDSVEVNATQTNVVGGCGLALFMKYLKRAGIFRMLNDRLPESLSNAGYLPEVYVKALWGLKLLYPDVNAPLTRIDGMRESKAIKQALMVREIPCSEAVGDWLRRMACCERIGRAEDRSAIVGGYEEGLESIRDMFYEVAVGVMGRMSKELGDRLDFDASCIYGEKKCDEWMYSKAKGSMGYLGFMGRICVMAELEKGNHSPSDSIGRRIGSCIGFAEKYGIEVKTVRSDSAAYESEVINACERAGRTFYVRADVDRAVWRACERIRDWRNYDVRMSKGKVCEREMGTAVHCMDRTDAAFTLVVKREVSRENGKSDNRLPGLEAPMYKYWCVATNESVKTSPTDTGLTPAEVEEVFNDHCNVESRIKQLKSDTGIGRLPTSELDANRVYVYIMAMLHNLFELFKLECLPSCYKNKRLPTVMRELLLTPGKIVVQSHKMVIDLPVYLKWMVKLYQEVLRAIREDVRAPAAAGLPSNVWRVDLPQGVD